MNWTHFGTIFLGILLCFSAKFHLVHYFSSYNGNFINVQNLFLRSYTRVVALLGEGGKLKAVRDFDFTVITF